MAESRLKNTTRNFFVASIQQFFTLVLGFASRWLFVKYLGAEYLGINGLFSNILMVLSMADLGFGSAIVFSMYKPLAENDENKLSALLYFYKKIYNVIALFIFLVGIGLIPFLGYIVNLDKSIPYLEVYYLLFLLNTVISYLFSYKMCIIIADQKNYLLNIYSFIFQVLQFGLQIIVLLFMKKYIFYLIVQVLCTFLNNLFSAYKSTKFYPFIKNKVELSKYERKEIWINIKSMFLYKIGGVLLNNTDNILISIMIGTVWVGYYSNYSMIITYIMTFTSIIFTSVSSSVGNLSVTTDIEYQYKVYKILDFLAFVIYSFCSICLFILMSDFIELLYGQNYRLDLFCTFIIVVNFYMPGLLRSTSTFRDATGIFKQTKYIFFITSLINLILSLYLGKIWGLTGIFVATALARLFTNYWFEPMILYRDYFNINPKYYFKRHLKNDLVFIITLIVTFLVANLFSRITILIFIYKMIICIVVPIILYFIIFKENEEFKQIKSIICNKFIKYIQKN